MMSWIAEMPVYLTKSMFEPGFGELIGKAIENAQSIIIRHCINNKVSIECVSIRVPFTIMPAVPNKRYYDDDITSLVEADPFSESIEARMVSHYAAPEGRIPIRRSEPAEFIVRLRMYMVK